MFAAIARFNTAVVSFCLLACLLMLSGHVTCVFVNLSVSLTDCLSACLSVCRSVRPSVHLSVRRHNLALSPSAYVCLSVCVVVRVSVCLPRFLCDDLSVSQ